MLQGLLGVGAFMGLAWLFSENRKCVNWRTVVVGLGLQLLVGLLCLKVPPVRELFLHLNTIVEILEQATKAGTSFVFGYVGGADRPFAEPHPGAAFVLAFQALPLILVVSALSSLLFYWRILPAIVRGVSWLLSRSMGIGGALGVGVGVNVFVGMVEAPLFIRPYLSRMTRSELFTLMTVGMATIAGTVLVLYASILGNAVPGALGHILTASLMSAPASVLIARLMIPETASPDQLTTGEITPPRQASGTMDAVAKGTEDGVNLLLHVTAMLLVLVALVALANQLLGLLPAVGGAPLKLERMLGWFMAPVVWLMGVPAGEAMTAGSLMGVKTVLNELLAYLQLAGLPEDALSERSKLIMTYGLCGFANPGSLGIMIGGMGCMAPDRRVEIVALGFRSIVAGTLAACMTGAMAGLLV